MPSAICRKKKGRRMGVPFAAFHTKRENQLWESATSIIDKTPKPTVPRMLQVCQICPSKNVQVSLLSRRVSSSPNIPSINRREVSPRLNWGKNLWETLFVACSWGNALCNVVHYVQLERKLCETLFVVCICVGLRKSSAR